MLKLSNIRLAERCGDSELRSIAAGILGISEELIETLRIHRLSTDARRKPDVRFVYTLLATVSDEQAVLAKLGTLKNARKGAPGGQSCIGRNISLYDPPERYVFPVPYPENIAEPLVIVGMGPAGLFAALCLAEAGVKCVVLERGQPVEERIASVLRFWREGRLDEASNVQFGEGGAGTFSDGKLTTSINDKRIQFVLEQLVRFGAPDDILYLAKPHIGTDRLRDVVVAMRKRLLELGCDLRFGHRLVDIEISGGALCGALVQVGAETYTISTHRLVLAPGNSSRDTFEILSRRGVSISPKGFSVGVRIEHLQRDIDCAQYGDAAVSVAATLPASDYKLVEHLDNGRSVYTFCVCPGGQVVAAASELGGVVTNGMSHYARDGDNICGALLVSVTPDDFGRLPLGGVDFQRGLEQAAFWAGGGDYRAPAQLVSDFLEKRSSTGHKKITPTYLPGVKYCNLWDVLPEFVCAAISQALLKFEKRIKGFSDPNAVLTAIETRSSCPVRIERILFEAIGARGIFPCGEGSGHAGGIMSAAVDGIRCAEAVAAAQKPPA